MVWQQGGRRSLVLVVALSGGAMVATSSGAMAQGVAVAPTLNNPYFAAPGNYGTSWGSASFKEPRTYSEFASPYGGGYSYGYAPSRILPGRYGVGLWRPGLTEGGYGYGAPGSYRTWAAPFVPGHPAPLPPIGLYAPAFGPSWPGW